MQLNIALGHFGDTLVILHKKHQPISVKPQSEVVKDGQGRPKIKRKKVISKDLHFLDPC